MIEEAFEGRIDIDLVNEIWPEYGLKKDILIQNVGTNIEQANRTLNLIMTPEERNCLEELLFGQEGWYKRINGEGMIRLKLASMSLGLSNNIFTFDPIVENEIKKRILQYSEEEQVLVIRCYMKQKLVSYLTLKNYIKNINNNRLQELILYRGINKEYNGEKYLLLGMESWTSNLDTAYRFARDGGYVIEKRYRISQIFASRRSAFKNKPYNLYRHNGFYVRREHEMIVENYDTIYDCSEGKNIRLSIDHDIF